MIGSTNSVIFEKIMTYSLDMICTISREGLFIHVSDACKKITGYDPSELIGEPYINFVFHEDRLQPLQLAQEVIRGNQTNTFTNRYYHKNGSIVAVSWSAVWSEEEGILFCIAREATERNILSQKLLVEQEILKALIEHGSDMLALLDRDANFTYSGGSTLRFLGYQHEQLIGRNALEFIHPEDVTKALQSLAAVLDSKEPVHLSEFRFKSASGEWRWLETTGTNQLHNPLVGALVLSSRDITDRIHSQRKAEEQARKLHIIFESITDAFFSLDKNWIYTYVNSEFERLTATKREDIIGKSIFELFSDGVDGDFHPRYTYAVETGTTVHFEAFSHKLNLWLEVKAFPYEDGLSVYFSDITNRVKAQSELKKLSLVASKTTNGVVISNKDRHIEWVNEGFTKLTGYTLEEVRGKRPIDFLHHEKTDLQLLESVQGQSDRGKNASFEILNKRKDGQDIWLSVEVNPVFDDNGELVNYVTTQTDITALKKSEIEQGELAKDLYKQNSALQQFTYIVSHNLRAPVANALGLTNLLKRVDKSSEVFDTSLGNLKESIIRLDTVLKDMNTILSVRDGKDTQEKEHVNVFNVLKQAAVLLQANLHSCKAGISIAIEEDRYIGANRAYLHSIFYNLLSNAIKYRSEDRILQINVECQEAPEGGNLIFFSDNGIGFDMHKVGNEIFKLYKRFHANKKGRGIGLFLIKTHVEAMDGHIEVSSQVNVGTRFQIYLP